MSLAVDVQAVRACAAELAAYAVVPIGFTVEEVYDVELGAGDGVDRAPVLRARRLERAWRKDYDALGEAPIDWPRRFDVSRWWVLVARGDGRRVGGGVLALRTAGLDMLELRDDLGVVWDLRVDPASRGLGVGAALLHAVDAKAGEEGLRRLKVETQNINVPACRLYAKHGYSLGAARRHAYPSLPEEIQLLWYKDLPPGQLSRA